MHFLFLIMKILREHFSLWVECRKLKRRYKEDNDSEFETKPQKDIPGRPALKQQGKRSKSKTPTKDFKVDKHLAKSKDP
jgi:hypothetical protein